MEKKVYLLVYRKFVGAFMEDYVYEVVKVITALNGEMFVSHGKRNISLGWMSLYESKENPLPDLKEGDAVEKLSVEALRGLRSLLPTSRTLLFSKRWRGSPWGLRLRGRLS